MPRNYKLTWQTGDGKRAGRWRKKYKGRVYYFAGGKGKGDKDAYDAAMAEWEKLKLRIDANTPKPHQQDYEKEIQKWESVLAWCRKQNEPEMADTAVTKQAVLRRGLSAFKPNPVRQEDTFDWQFDRASKFPGYHESIAEIGEAVERASASFEPSPDWLGFEAYTETREALKGINLGNALGAGNGPVIVPTEKVWESPDSLSIEREIWKDRLEVAQRLATGNGETLEEHLELFIEKKTAASKAGEISLGRPYKLGLHLSHFVDWLGRSSPVSEITGKTLSKYHAEILNLAESNSWSLSTANDRIGSVKSFIHWLWEIEVLESLPRNMIGRSNTLKISKPNAKIIVFEKEEVTKLLKAASARTKLYILLMLNCGMTQKDISDLKMEEVDWHERRVTRKRSKTRKFENVPEVSYPLWPETFRLLLNERSTADSGRVC